MRRRIQAAAQQGIGTPYKGDDGLWRIDNVPICETGIEYKLSSGPHTFTESELADAVRAASGGDVAINAPRIKLGHKSNANDLFLGGDEPAFGRVEAMRLSDNKQRILGTYVGTPEWLAKVLPVAYPSRSVDAQIGVETATGKRYEMVVTDVSLLGITWPGCSVLEDLPLWYGSELPADAGIAASLDVTQIRKKFYTEGPGATDLYRWIRGERVTDDGYTLIVDEGNGDISRIPVVVDGDEVQFGSPVQVVEEYTDKAVAAEAVLAGMAMADPAMVIHATRADTAPNTNQEGDPMDEELRQSLAARLGLPTDATEEQIRSELSKPVNETVEDDTGDDDGDGDGDDEDEKPSSRTDTVTLDRATFDQIKRGADLAASHETDRVRERISSTVEAAVTDGRIPPARRDHWKTALTADFDGNKAILDGLEKGLIPVHVRGNSGNDEEGGNAGQDEGFPEEWFPEIKTLRANAAPGRRVTNAKEG